MEERFDRLESLIAALGNQMAAGFSAVDQRLVGVDKQFSGVNERFERVDEQFASVNEQFASVRHEMRQGDENTRSRLSTHIESLRDDIRIFAEAHVSLEKRVTALERHPR